MPIPVVSIAQMRSWEQATWASGKTEAEVIRAVGKAVAAKALAITGPEARILVIAGKGHNGDDARLACEHLGQRRADFLQITDPVADLPKLNALIQTKPDLLIDGLFGIGINRVLSPEWVKVIECINSNNSPILAVDVPSGLNGDSGVPEGAAVKATLTLTVGAAKRGLLQDAAGQYVGRLEVAHDVGLIACGESSELLWTVEEDFHGYPARRDSATHKGTYGHLALLAGSLGYHGAAVLAAKSAQRAQPGLITLYSLDSVYAVTASQLQAVMVSPWQLHGNFPGDFNAVVAGPGLAAPEAANQMKQVVRLLWRDALVPVIVDASALDWLPMDPTPRNAIRVITPHPGEAARLLNSTPKQVQADRVSALRNVSKRFANAWVVLKGHQTLVGRSTGPVYINSTGNPHLAQGGSGDCLAGFLGGLLAQPLLQKDPSMAIRYAVLEHGRAADKLTARCHNWTVEELIAELGRGS